MSAPQKILITGATGFIGRHVMHLLDVQGHELVVITRKENAKFPSLRNEPRIVYGNINDEAVLQSAMQGIDVIVHLAAELADAKLMQSTNIDAVNKIVAVGRSAGVKRMVHLSSVGVTGMQYRSSSVSVTEDTTCDPKNEYERTKLAAEEIVRKSHWSTSGGLTILRPTNVYGEDHPRAALLNLFRHVKSGRTVYATRSAMVNYVYVQDVAAIIAHAAVHAMKHNCYQVGGAIHLTDMIRLIAKAEHKEPNVRIVSKFILSLARLGGFFASSLKGRIRSLSNEVVYSDARLLAEFSYPFGYARGIINTVEHYKASGHLK